MSLAYEAVGIDTISKQHNGRNSTSTTTQDKTDYIRGTFTSTMSRFLRSFSKLAVSQKQLEKDEILKAAKLLSSKSFDSVTTDEKAKYINYFTRALNTDIKPTKVSNVSANHFSQSLLGLNSILKNTPMSHISATSEPLNAKDAIARCENEQQVLSFFEELLVQQKLEANSLRYILMSKNVQDIAYINDRLNFMKLHDLKLLVCSKSMMVKDFKYAKEIYDANIRRWIQMRDEGSLTRILEKSLYQLMWKISRDLNALTSLKHTQTSAILLIEAMPRQFYNLEHIFLDFTITKNQQLFLDFLSYLVSRPISAASNKFIQQLTRLNVQNGISTETDNKMTIQKYRYINGLLDLAESMKNEYADESVDILAQQVHELDDVVLNETVLKFV